MHDLFLLIGRGQASSLYIVSLALLRQVVDLLVNIGIRLSSQSVVLLVSQKQEHLDLSLWLVDPQASPQVFSALISPAKGTTPHIPHPHSQQIGRSCQGLITGQWYRLLQQAGSGHLLSGKMQIKFFPPPPLSSALPKPWHPCSHHVQNKIRGPFLLSHRIPWPDLLCWRTTRQETNRVSHTAVQHPPHTHQCTLRQFLSLQLNLEDDMLISYSVLLSSSCSG